MPLKTKMELFLSVDICIVLSAILCVCLPQDRQHAQEMSLPEQARHHLKELRRVLVEIGALKGNNLGPNALTTSNQSQATSDQSTLAASLSDEVLRSLPCLTSSVHNIGPGSSANFVVNNFNFYSSQNDKIIQIPATTVDEKSESQGSPDSDTNSVTDTDTEERIGSPKIVGWHVLSNGTGPLEWFDRAVRPSGVTAKRNGDLVTLTFNVSHAGPAVVHHSWSLDGHKVVLKGPQEVGLGSGSAIASTVEFMYNASICFPLNETSAGKKEYFSFVGKGSDLDTMVTVRLHTCFFNRNDIAKDEKLQYHQKFRYSDFWKDLDAPFLTSSKADDGNTLKMNVSLRDSDTFAISGTLYDPLADVMNSSNTLIIFPQLGVMMADNFNRPEDLKAITVDIDNEELVHYYVNETAYLNRGDEELALIATLQISVSLSSDEIYGNIYLINNVRQRASPNEDNIVMGVAVRKTVPLMSASGMRSLPEGKFLKDSHFKRFSCGSGAPIFYIMFKGFENTCVAICSVTGSGIKNVRIKKVNGGVKPLSKYVEINPDNAYLLANLGPASKEVDGEYECKAVSKNRKVVRWRIQVRTWGFPKVIKHNLTFSEDSATILCVGSTVRHPMDISILLVDSKGDETRIDDDSRLSRTLADVGDNEKQLTLTVPLGVFKYPIRSVNCHVNNTAGESDDHQVFYPDDIKDYYLGTDHPNLIKSQSTITDHGNGTTSLTCTAQGKMPVTIDFYTDYESSDTLINNDTVTSSRSQQIVDSNTTTITLNLPTSFLRWPKSWILCRAQNDLGSVALDFNLMDYILSYYD